MEEIIKELILENKSLNRDLQDMRQRDAEQELIMNNQRGVIDFLMEKIRQLESDNAQLRFGNLSKGV